MAKRGVGVREAAMRQLLAEQEASGLSVASFARQREVAAWTLYDWRRRLRERARRERAGKASFIQVKVRPEWRAPSTIQVEVRAGVRVHVPVGFDEGELRRLLGVLGSC